MTPADPSVRFGPFEFDPETGVVTRRGAYVARLQEQPSRVLEALTSRPGRLVTRDELQRLLWPENSLVDADNGLNIAVKKIRLALGDSPTAPRFIQTVPRRGYRFVGEIAPAAAAPEASVASTARPSSRPRHARVFAVGALVALSLIATAIWRRPSPSATTREAVLPNSVRVPIELRDEYLRRRYYFTDWTPQDAGAAVERLTHAIEMDRENALAWAALADLYTAGVDVPSSLFAPWPGTIEAAVQAAQQAVRLDPTLAEPHVALGELRVHQWRWRDAELELAEAVRLSPNYAGARHWYTLVLARLGRCPGAMEQAGAAIAVDRADPLSAIEAGLVLASCGESARAVATFTEVLAAHPAFPMTHLQLAGAYLGVGDPRAAIAEYQQVEQLRADNCEVPARMAGAYEALGRHDEARAQAARVAGYASSESSIQYCTAIADASTRDIDGAFAALDTAVAVHDQRMFLLLNDTHLVALHSDPRWSELIERIGLAPYAQRATLRIPEILRQPSR